MSDREFEALDGGTVYEGRIVDVRVERFRYPDGAIVSREIVRTAGAVAIVAYDAERVWLVRQPREAVSESDLLELPAGRLDVEGEQPAAAAKRELAEEVGLGARTWRPLLSYYSSAGFTDERVHVFCASDLYECSAEADSEERIEIVPWPLSRLDQAIEQISDAKTLIGLMALSRHLNA